MGERTRYQPRQSGTFRYVRPSSTPRNKSVSIPNQLIGKNKTRRSSMNQPRKASTPPTILTARSFLLFSRFRKPARRSGKGKPCKSNRRTGSAEYWTNLSIRDVDPPPERPVSRVKTSNATANTTCKDRCPKPESTPGNCPGIQ